LRVTVYARTLQDMQHLTSTIQSSRVVIDCSKLFAEDRTEESNEVSSLVDWVRSFPRRSDVHVVLGGGRSRQVSRRLQGRLQAMGCTVTSRTAF
jgi:hypothetical protein